VSGSLRTEFDGLQKRALAVGVVASIAAAAGAVADPVQFYRSYLVAWLFWFGLGLGSLAIVLLHRMTGGSWGFAIRRLLESGMRTLPLLALLFVRSRRNAAALPVDGQRHCHDLLQHRLPISTRRSRTGGALLPLWIQLRGDAAPLDG
jgi:hypothetical protein